MAFHHFKGAHLPSFIVVVIVGLCGGVCVYEVCAWRDSVVVAVACVFVLINDHSHFDQKKKKKVIT